MNDGPKLTDHQQVVLKSIRTAIRAAPVPSRSCGECAKCCEGWLSGEAYGHIFSPGRPCFFLEKTCSIYKDRPVNPCRHFECSWLSEDIFPMWLKPSLANIIISKQQHHNPDLTYYIVDQAGDTFDRRALNWLLEWAKSSNANVMYRIGDETTKTGSPEFMSI